MSIKYNFFVRSLFFCMFSFETMVSMNTIGTTARCIGDGKVVALFDEQRKIMYLYAYLQQDLDNAEKAIKAGKYRVSSSYYTNDYRYKEIRHFVKQKLTKSSPKNILCVIT